MCRRPSCWHARRNGERLDPATIDWSGITAENFPGMLRQLPGVKNPLGRIKFIFPNHYAVYLHDTSSPQLFQQSRRMFSSGCIRVQRPVELAEFLLEGQAAWDGERIREQMAAQETSTVSLEQPVPVHLLYWTAWVDEAGRVQFRSDIYRRDELLRQALSLPAPPPLATARLRAGP